MQQIISFLFYLGSYGAPGIFLGVLSFFLGIYLFTSLTTHLVVEKLLLPRGIGARVDPRSPARNQIKDEIKNSLVSILVFAAHATLIYYLYQANLVAIRWAVPTLQIWLEVFVLFIWNEIHFYACHRLLHTRWLLKRVHSIHHRSVVTTPFSTFSFHWFESALLGSVMLLALICYNFSFHALFVLPLISIIGNSLGHSNFSIFKEGTRSPSRSHRQHHYRSNVNFGFLLPVFDEIFKTAEATRKEEKL